MTVADDASALLAYLDSNGIDGAARIDRGWPHMGAVVVDSALQRRQRYRPTVLPRIRGLIEAWPDASTTSAFAARFAAGDLGAVIRWSGRERLEQIQQTAEVLQNLGIETVAQFGAALADPVQRVGVRSALRRVRGVGDKTLDYFDVLTNNPEAVAVDVRVRAVARRAGITNVTYRHLADVIRVAARGRGWRPSDLDAAIWASGD